MAGMTRKEQRARTHEALLDATVQCLVDHGYAGTTMQAIQDEAGVTRGAVLHHFSSKSDLLVASIHHIAELRLRQLEELVADLDEGPRALSHVVTAIRTVMTGPHFQAALELWAASRTDPQLRAALLPAERRLGAELRKIFDEHSGILDPEEARTAFESLLSLVRGLELTSVIRTDRALEDRIIDGWLDALARRRAAR